MNAIERDANTFDPELYKLEIHDYLTNEYYQHVDNLIDQWQLANNEDDKQFK